MFILDKNKIKLTAKKKNKEKRIFLDMDGVLANFNKSLCEVCDVDIEDPKIRQALKEGKYLSDLDIISEDDAWSLVNAEKYEFWETLEILPWAKKLYDEMSKIGKVSFLSSPGRCDFAPSGKMRWIREHFGEDALDTLSLVRNKYYCANPDAVLVDDSESKVNDFKEAGGLAFLWPAELNFIDGDKDVDEVIEELKKYIESN